MAITSDYARLEERILARDQVGASAALYELIKQKRPVTEIISQTVRIHAPYTHVPYHQRLDDGVVKFVNNDHCLLGERVALPLMSMVRPELSLLPLAQVVWYIPTGLDPWNQLLGKAPGHYTRLYEIKVDQAPPKPEAHWPDQEPLRLDGPLAERLNHWLTLVQRGEVLTAYRVFFGLMEDAPNRRQVLAHLAFAGLIDVQDRMLHNRSYTTGHKSFRARATIELGEALGWNAAHHVLYAGVPDMAVGPRWYSTYEMGCNVVQNLLDGRDADLLRQEAPLTPAEEAMLVETLTRQREWSVLEPLEATLLARRPDEAVALTATYLKAGFDRAPLVETLASAAAKVGHDPHNQELGLCLLEDYLRSTAADRERLLLASAQHTAGHRKYGDHLESYRRFAEAFGL